MRRRFRQTDPLPHRLLEHLGHLEVPAGVVRVGAYQDHQAELLVGLVALLGEIEQEVARARSRRELAEEIADAPRSAGGPETARSQMSPRARALDEAIVQLDAALADRVEEGSLEPARRIEDLLIPFLK